jgi:uncharacterized membrane protein (DUF106 family)
MYIKIKKGGNEMIHYNEKILDATKRMSQETLNKSMDRAKNHNEKIMDATKRMSQETLNKSMDRVKKLTRPSKKVSRIGSKIGMVVGILLIIIGVVGILLGRKWGIGSCLAGVTSIISNIINLKKNE